MLRSKILPATVAAVLAFSVGGSAFAANSEHESDQEIAAVLAAKTSIGQAIAAAERGAGGHAMKIGFEKEGSTYLYKVRTVSKDKVSDLFIDPTSGAVVRTEDEGLIARVFEREDRDEFAKLATSPTTLATAVAAGEKEVGGKAVEARFETEDGAAQFEVEVAKDKAVHVVMIDGATGKVLKVSQAEGGEHGED